MVNSIDLEFQAEALIGKLKHYLITTMGVTLSEARDEEFFRAFSLTIREEIMINWTASVHTINKKRPRTLYYLCMEYMPGRLLENNISNMHANQLVQLVMKKVGRDFKHTMLLEPDPALGNGGLGRLASCLLDSLATQQYPAIGYGLRYQYGIFEQEIWNGMQVERPEVWLLHENPWEFRRDIYAVNVAYNGELVSTQNLRGEEVFDLINQDEVRALAYDIPIVGYRETPDFNVLSLRIWTTKESPRNFALQRYNAGLLDQAAENTTLTDVLYPNDNHEMGKRIRLKQEFLLASASLQNILSLFEKNYGGIEEFADKARIHINDTHPALAIAELMRLLLKNYNYSWGEAFDIVRTCCNYTNHTVLREALEEWNEQRLEHLLPRQYQIIRRLNADFCGEIRRKYPNDEERVRRMSIIEEGQIKMAHLAIYGSHRVNGVAALHTEILRKDIFRDFAELYPDKVVNVTNGVTQRRWIFNCNPRLSEFIIRRIGRGWITDLNQIEQLSQYASDPTSQEEFLVIKRANKEDCIKYLKKHNPFRGQSGGVIGFPELLDETALFDVQIKRFHEYKRQLLPVLHTLILYNELSENLESRPIKRTVVIGGKAAPGYDLMKHLILLIHCIIRKIDQTPGVRDKLRLVFLENYNASRAEKIIPAVDLSEQVSCAGMEASGTGNMKMAMNGALTIGTDDGANLEMHAEITDQWWPFGFGKSAQENRAMHEQRSYHPRAIYEKNSSIQKAVDMLRDGSLAQSSSEQEALRALYHALMEGDGISPDRYFVLGDMESYIEAQHKVEALYLQPNKWAECVLQNIAHVKRFSTDESIKNYARLVWGLLPEPVDLQELAHVRQQYSEHDKCRIF